MARGNWEGTTPKTEIPSGPTPPTSISRYGGNVQPLHVDDANPAYSRLKDRDSYRPTPADEEALALIAERYHPVESLKASLERLWQFNIAFMMGNQWAQWNERQWGLVTRPKSKRWRVRETRNMIRPVVDRACASMSEFTPRFVGVPNTLDVEDIQASRKAEKVMNHYWRHGAMDEKKELLAYWTITCGTSFLKVRWDPKAGRSFVGPSVDEFGNIEQTEDGQPIERHYHEGDIVYEVRNGFQIHGDPLAETDEEQPWILDVGIRHLSWIEEHFPDKAMYVESDLTNTEEAGHQRNVNQNASHRSGGLGQFPDAQTSDEWVVVKEFWQIPSGTHPRGRLIIVADDVVLHNDINPTPDYELPYARFIDLPVPGRWWGQSIVENLITPQRNYNKLRSKKLEHLYMMGMNMKVLAPQMAGLPQTTFVSEVGEIVRFNGPTPPQYLQIPPLPPESEQESMIIKQDMDMITSTHGAERGQYQGKLSGVALEHLIEQGLKSKVPRVRRMARSYERIGRLTLKLAQKHITEQRMIKITGKNNQFEVEAFMGADLRNNTDIAVDVNAAMPRSRTLALQEVTALQQAGFLNPMNPNDRALGFQMMDLEAPDLVLEKTEIHVRAAQNENRLMLAGVPVQGAQWFEDQDTHYAEHTAEMNSDRFKASPPEVQALFYAHMQTHQQLALPQPGVTLPPGMQNQLLQPNAKYGGGDDGEA